MDAVAYVALVGLKHGVAHVHLLIIAGAQGLVCICIHDLHMYVNINTGCYSYSLCGAPGGKGVYCY